MIFKKMVVFWLVTLTFASLTFSQSDKKPHPNSPVFKNYQLPTTTPLLEQSDVTYQMWQGFQVMGKANAGDAVSQFELSIRYLTGRGFKADTAKAVYWSKRAAEQNHLLARYNLAIFEFNGWGTDWNPFRAYEDFRYAADRNVEEAQYVLAQFFTENLVLPRNIDSAYQWVKLAADSGYVPAKETLKEFEKRGFRSPIDSSGTKESSGKTTNPSAGALQFQLLNFSPDTVQAPSDTVLFEDAVKAAMLSKDKEFHKIFGAMNSASELFQLDSAAFNALEQSAEAGSPEALTLLGWCYERGVRVPRESVLAAVYYVRAIRLDALRASRLLFGLLQKKEFFDHLRQRVNKNDPDALYVWACIVALGFDRQVTDAQALQMLERAVARDYPQAMVELGLCYYAGRWVGRDERKAEEAWRKAEMKGSTEAGVRLAVMKIRGKTTDLAPVLETLERAAIGGSVLAEVALAYCYENGLGVQQNQAEAAKLYRISVQRGSQDAYSALLRMHDAIRPRGQEFRVVN